jgi:valyl-tRNA synthetase
MSKSLGNAIDPMTDLVPLYGADGTRFGLVRQMRLESQELRFDTRQCDEAKRFCTKLWNALRYTVALEEGLPPAGVLPKTEALTVADRWILTELRRCIETVSASYDGFAFGVAADTLLQFGWYRLCDWYVEATKAPGGKETRGAVLSFVLNAFVRAMHPIAPFVSEEIWLTLPHDGATIVTASWPDVAEIPEFPDDAATFRALIDKVEELRAVRAEWRIPPKEAMQVAIPATLAAETGLVQTLATIARAEFITYENGTAGSLGDRIAAVRAVADPVKLLERYERESTRLVAEYERSMRKLANRGFVNNAAPDVVAAERAKADGFRDELARIRRALDELG